MIARTYRRRGDIEAVQVTAGAEETMRDLRLEFGSGVEQSIEVRDGAVSVVANFIEGRDGAAGPGEWLLVDEQGRWGVYGDDEFRRLFIARAATRFIVVRDAAGEWLVVDTRRETSGAIATALDRATAQEMAMAMNRMGER